jgi:hypothetical protein
MQSFKITMKDNSHEGIYQLEAAIRNAQQWVDFWGQKDGEMSQAWANSRMIMFATQGASTGPKWPGYTAMEKKYYVPMKTHVLKVRSVGTGGILRWTSNPMQTSKANREILWPSMCTTNGPGYVWQVNGNQVECGTSVPYAQNHDKGQGSWDIKISAASIARTEAAARKAAAAYNNAKDAAARDRADKRQDKLLAKLQRKKQDASGGVIKVPTPKRPLVRFGDGFIDVVRQRMQNLAMNQAHGAKVGITSNEFGVRYLLGRQGGGGTP